jgi:hypothetical protein
MAIIDLTGQQFNRWNVQRFSHIDHRGEAYWLCCCECGTVKEIAGYSLRKGTSKGCSNCRPYNRLTGSECEIVDGKAVFTTSRGRKFQISTSDVELVKKYKWSIARDGYPVANVDGVTKKLHYYLMGKVSDCYIDHINGDKLDNRRENLRVATFSQNACNSDIGKNNTSGFKGVYWDKKHKRWFSCITLAGKTHYLGNFPTKILAALRYNEAAKELFMEFACLNPVGDTSGYRVCKKGTDIWPTA